MTYPQATTSGTAQVALSAATSCQTRQPKIPHFDSRTRLDCQGIIFREDHTGHNGNPFRGLRRRGGIVKAESESFHANLVARRVGEEGVPKASVCCIAVAVPENSRPADVCHHFGFDSSGHIEGMCMEIREVGMIVFLRHRIEIDRDDGSRIVLRDLDPSEVCSNTERPVEARVLLSEAMESDFEIPVRDPQLRLVSGLQEHLLLQGNRTIDDASPMLRDCSDVEEISELEEREDGLQEFFCREDAVACSIHRFKKDSTRVELGDVLLILPCVDLMLCDTGVRDVSQISRRSEISR